METTVAVKVEARRSDGWWAITVPDHPGMLGQARRLDQIEGVARELHQLLLDLSDAEVADLEFDVAVVDEVVEGLLADLDAATTAARAAEATLDEARRLVVRRLTAEGYTQRDIGAILGVSHQRVSQLAA
jgi:DNA-directed RNA polymerase specialized sigma subunit